MSRPRYALVGAGSRAGMYLDALAGPYREDGELVALCDSSRTRIEWHRRRLRSRGVEPAAYGADEFDRMVRETRPDVVIVATIDRLQGARENIEKEGFAFDTIFTKADLGIA